MNDRYYLRKANRIIKKLNTIGFNMRDTEATKYENSYSYGKFPIVILFEKEYAEYTQTVEVSQKHTYDGYVGSLVHSYAPHNFDSGNSCGMRFEEMKLFYKLAKVFYKVSKEREEK